MRAKRYYFYEANPATQKILDGLQKQRLLSDVIQSIINNGLEKEIEKRRKAFEKLTTAVMEKEKEGGNK